MTEDEEEFCEISEALEDGRDALVELIMKAEGGAGAKVSTIQPRAVLENITRYLEKPEEFDDLDIEDEDALGAIIEAGLDLVEETTTAIRTLTDDLLRAQSTPP